MSSVAAENQPERVLSTLNADGSRRWLKPWVSPGRFLHRRRMVAYGLIVVFTIMPYLRIGGKPPILLDIPAREFTFFGTTFYPTDTLPLAILVVSIFVAVFLLTALLGRVWCGWACPQTVYMEFLYRPIERLFEGKPGRKKKTGAWRKPAKYAVYFVVSMFLAHTFLAYFVGVERLWQWVQSSPAQHPVAFLVMAGTTGLMMFDFAFFREQTCLVACPYGRFQSVMLDRQSLIVTYDELRGEPRGKVKKSKKSGDVRLPVANEARGDCVDCGMCVRTCPTGIDIREGLQMECIGCAQCIDACDAVMDKVGRPKGLIRYSSQAAVAGENVRLLRPRVLIYPALLIGLLTALTLVVAGRQIAEVTLTRGVGSPFVVLPDGDVSNQIRVKIRNRAAEVNTFQVELVDLATGRIVSADNPFTVEPGHAHEAPMTIIVPPNEFKEGHRDIQVRIATDDDAFSTTRSYRLLGPWATPNTESEHEDEP